MCLNSLALNSSMKKILSVSHSHWQGERLGTCPRSHIWNLLGFEYRPSLGPVLTITNDFQLMARKGTVPVVGFKFTSVGLEESPLRSSPADCWMQMAGVWRHCGPWSLTSEQKPPSPMTPMWCVCTEATRYLQARVHLTIICLWQWWRCGHWLASVESVRLHLSLNYFSF